MSSLPRQPDSSPAILLIDDGELDRVHALLDFLGIEATRLQGAAIPGEVLPPRDLLVTSGQRALKAPRFQPSDDGAAPSPVWLVVHDDQTPALRERLRSLGVHYLAHRTVDDDTLRLLLQQILYRGDERRRARRLPTDCVVRVVVEGHSANRARLVELSRDTLCLRYQGRPVEGTRLRVALPAVLCGSEVVLAAVVLRSSPLGDDNEGESSVVARLDQINSAVQRRLDAFLRGESEEASIAPLAPAPRRESSSDTPGAYVDGTGVPNWEEMASQGERRRHQRSRYAGRVDAFSAAGKTEKYVGLGANVSLQGVWIGGDSNLELGMRVTLSLHGGQSAEPVIVDAEVKRKNESGVALEFTGVTPALRSQLEHLTKGLAPLESLVGTEVERVVVSRILEELD